MKTLPSAALTLAVLSIASIGHAQTAGVKSGSSLAAGIAVNLHSNLGSALTFNGFPYVSGTAPSPFDRFFPSHNVGGSALGLGSVTAQNAYVRATSNVDGTIGEKFSRGSVVVQNLVIQIGSNIRVTAAAVNSASRAWGVPGQFLCASSTTFQSASLDAWGNHVSMGDTIGPNLHLLNDKGLVVTANEQSTSGAAGGGLSRVTTALHLKFTNVPVNGQFVTGDIYVGRTFAQVKG